ncbi:MAG: energy-coupling factor ABC transporter substrate-binding protein [Negativicutes bacterium]|nr:energy-coupling factor ABC transporter substrate-binding protein [Negativicutes bacterium]
MSTRKTVLLLLLAVALVVVPLAWRSGADFGGTDDKAKDVISEINPDYKPWFSSLWEPPSAEVESFLFALQAALGAGFIGYFFGYRQGQKASREKADKECYT